jgi:hypothetical protein
MAMARQGKSKEDGRGLDLERLGLAELHTTAGKAGPPLAPLDRRLLLKSLNPPATMEVPADQLVVGTARLVRARRGAAERVTLVRSEEFKDFFELPETLEPAFGLEGRSERIIRATPPSQREGKLRLLEGIAEPAAPDWLPLGIHPVPVFEEGQQDATLRNGRRIRLSGNHIQIFGDDNRINIYPSTWPECCVCRIEIYTKATSTDAWTFRARATGFMVGRRVMMTSGHARPPKPYAGWMIKVVPASFDGQSIFGPGFLSYASDYVAYQSDTGNDFMVCRLYDPIGDTTGWFGAISYNSDWEDWSVWSMAGYPYDRGEVRPTYQGSIAVVDDDDGDNISLPSGAGRDTTQIESYADEASGASGSPMYSWFTSGNMYAIGAHHGRETDWGFFGSDTHSVASGGDGFVGLIKWAKQAWP